MTDFNGIKVSPEDWNDFLSAPLQVLSHPLVDQSYCKALLDNECDGGIHQKQIELLLRKNFIAGDLSVSMILRNHEGNVLHRRLHLLSETVHVFDFGLPHQ
jgi:hypothetical protein